LLTRKASSLVLSLSPLPLSLLASIQRLGAGWLGGIEFSLWVESSQLLDILCVGERRSLLVL
jgi:hypothetical protein